MSTGPILSWNGGQIDLRVEAGVGINDGVGLWGSGLWDTALWNDETFVVWSDITSSVYEVSISRGKARWGQRYNAGTMTLTLDDTDGRFTPDAGANPFSLSFRPGRLLRVVVVPDPDAPEAFSTLFTGRITDTVDSFTESGAVITTKVVVSDALAELGNINPPASSATGVTRSDERVTDALDNVSWPAARRLLQTGAHDVQSSDLAQTVLEECMRAAEAEGGELFASADNVIVFRARDYLLGGTESIAFYTAGTLLKEPVAYWTFTDDATADETGNGHTLTFNWSVGPTIETPGVISDDEAVTLNGTGDYATVANETDLELEQDMSIEMWVRPHAASGSADQCIISCRASSDPLYEVRYNPDFGFFSFFPLTVAGDGMFFNASGLNEWSHIVITIQWIGSTHRRLTFYKDGSQVNTALVEYQPNPTSPVINIGRRAVHNDLYFDGDISELVIYDYVLSADEVSQQYSSTFLTSDDSRSVVVQGHLGYDTEQVSGTPYAPITAVETSYELARVRNDIQLAKTGGSVQRAQDATSQGLFGQRSYQRTDLINNADADVLFLANRQLEAEKDLRRRVDSVTIAANNDPNNDDLNRLFWAMEFGDLVTVNLETLNGWSSEFQAHVFGIEHHITADDWTVKFRLDDALT